MAFSSPFFVLMIGDDGALLLPPRGFKKASPVCARTHDEEQAAALLSVLKDAPRTSIIVLADILAQNYKKEILPPLAFFDRKKLLARRLEQAFPKALLKTALPLSKTTALLASAEDKGPLGLWLDRLHSLKNPSGTLCLLPMESANMTALLAPVSLDGWGLLLSCHKTGGFRQIVTHKGEMIFTRLTPPHPEHTHVDAIAESLAQDIQATRSYLARMGLTEGTPLHLAAILPSALHAPFSAQKMPLASQILFSPREASARLGLALPPGTGELSADLVHALWLQTRAKRKTNLMRPSQRKEQQTQKIMKSGSTLAILFGLLAVLTLGMKGATLWSLSQENKEKQGEVAALESELETARHTLAKEAAPLDRLRKAVERRRLFSEKEEIPKALIDGIGSALGSEARTLSFDWQKGELKLELLLKDDSSKNQIDELARQKMVRSLDNIAFLLRGALVGYTVDITQYPFPTLPNETITNKGLSTRRAPPVVSLLIREEMR